MKPAVCKYRREGVKIVERISFRFFFFFCIVCFRLFLDTVRRGRGRGGGQKVEDMPPTIRISFDAFPYENITKI